MSFEPLRCRTFLPSSTRRSAACAGEERDQILMATLRLAIYFRATLKLAHQSNRWNVFLFSRYHALAFSFSILMFWIKSCSVFAFAFSFVSTLRALAKSTCQEHVEHVGSAAICCQASTQLCGKRRLPQLMHHKSVRISEFGIHE